MGICNEGFDPKRRSGQAYGRGEYFGVNVGTSHSYAGSTGRMIVTMVIKGKVVDGPGKAQGVNHVTVLPSRRAATTAT